MNIDFHWYDLLYGVIGAVIGWISKLLQNMPQKTDVKPELPTKR